MYALPAHGHLRQQEVAIHISYRADKWVSAGHKYFSADERLPGIRIDHRAADGLAELLGCRHCADADREEKGRCKSHVFVFMFEGFEWLENAFRFSQLEICFQGPA